MKKIILLASSVVTLAACTPYQGNLTITSDLKVSNDIAETDPRCQMSLPVPECLEPATLTIPAGNYQAKLEMTSKTTLQIRTAINGSNKTINLEIPKNSNIPTSNGTFSISAKDLKQTFGLNGNIATDVKNSESQSGYDSCTYQDSYEECDGPHGECHTEWRTVIGSQYVEYYNQFTHQDFNVSFLNNVNSNVVGNFKGSRDDTSKIITASGPCL